MLTIQEYLTGYREIGLLDHLSADELESVRERAGSLNVESRWLPLLPLLILDAAPDAVYYVRAPQHFAKDTTSAEELLDSTLTFLRHLVPISHGKFVPDEITGEVIAVDAAETMWRHGQVNSVTGIEAGFTFRDRRYAHRTFLNPNGMPARRESYDLLNLANKALQDAEAEERFFWIVYRDDLPNDAGPLTAWAVVLLNPAQQGELAQRRWFIFFKHQPYTWSPSRIDQLVEELRDIGLLDHLDPQQVEEIRQKIRAEPLDNVSWTGVVGAFPGVMFGFDSEMIYDPPKNYHRLVTETAALARGAFPVANIEITPATWEEPDFTISFDYQGRTYSHASSFQSDWVDFGYLELMNRALMEARQPGRFMILDTGGQEAMLVYVTPEQVEKCQRSQWLRLSDWQRLWEPG